MGIVKSTKHMENNDKLHLILATISTLTETIDPLIRTGDDKSVEVVTKKIIDLVKEIKF